MSKLVMVAGGAGFLGGHLVDRLLGMGNEVVVLDDLSTGSPDNLAHHGQRSPLTFIHHDIVQPLPEALPSAARVFNLACPASPPAYQRQPVQTALSSMVGMWRLLEWADARGARVLQASTSEIYGDPDVHPQPEEYFGNVSPIGPRSCYDEGKRAAEALCFAYQRQKGTAIRIARLFNCYGPRLRPGDGRVVSNFIVQALSGQPLTIFGSGEQTRSFCYVDDTVDALLKLMEGSTIGPLNVGNPVEHSMLELAETILRLTGSRSSLIFRPLPEHDPRRRRPDIAQIRSALDWQPRVSLEDGLRMTIDYFRQTSGQRGGVDPELSLQRWPRTATLEDRL